MELWTFEHFITLVPSLIVMLIISFILNRWLGKKDLKIRMIPFQIIVITILLLEIGKQGLSFYRGYDLYHIPLHFCSLFLYVLPLMAFYKGKYKDVVNSIASTTCVCLFIFMLVYPNLIYSAGNIKGFFTDYFDFHTVFFHNLVLFAFMVIIALKLYTPSAKKHYKGIVLFGIGYSLIAGGMAQILEVNFSNFYSCNIGPIEAIRTSLIGSIGYVATQFIYVSVLAILHVLFILFAYVIFLGIKKIVLKLTK